MRTLALVFLLSCAPIAAAQIRPIPAEANRGQIRHLQEMTVEINGKPRKLSPGAQIRDTSNRLVLPISLIEKREAKFLLDAQGNVHRVWLLSEKEIAELPRAPVPKSSGYK